MVKNRKDKGGDFERMIKRMIQEEEKNADVFRQASSLFPDLILMVPLSDDEVGIGFLECKSSREGNMEKSEKERMQKLLNKYDGKRLWCLGLLVTKDKKGHIVNGEPMFSDAVWKKNQK